MAEGNMEPAVNRSLFVTIAGNIAFGGGLTLHTEYQLSVQLNQENWLIYRRYSHFESLYKSVAQKLGEAELQSRQIAFPEKVYFGSILSTHKSVIDQRRMELQAFLESVFITNDFLDEEFVHQFIDIQNKGISGLHRQLGADKILKETFCRVKIIKQFFALWQMCYVVVLRDGTLYVLQSMYDDTTHALMDWALMAVGVQVIPRSRDNTIVISASTHQQRLILSLPTPLESASWMRALTDFATATSFQQTVAAGDAARAQMQSSNLSRGGASSVRGGGSGTASKTDSATPTFTSPSQAQPVVKNVYAKGTGNTTDEMSAMYGI